MFVWEKGALNEEQEAAVWEDGSVFLVACPGSGKTRTLTYKAATELSKLQSERKRVIAITYTNRAADEIHERIDRLGVDTSQLWIGTIHAFCLEWILRPYAIYHDALKHGFRVINSYDTEEILKRICTSYTSPKITHRDCGHHYTSNSCIRHCRDSSKIPSIKAVLKEYWQYLLSNRQLDFDLILKCAHTLLVKNPSISKLLAGIFSCILVDEYQDTRQIQYSILAEILKTGGGNVTTFIVGDPSQAIYGSLGGYAITAGEFREIAQTEIKEMELSRNHRSSERIVGYFGQFNVHAATIISAADHRNYPSVISYDTSTTKEGLEAELGSKLNKPLGESTNI